MSNFYARICENGHVDISYRRAREETCRKCGSPLMDSCPRCGSIIKVWHYYGMVYLTPKNLEFQPPQCCRECGAVFPWAED